LDLGGFAKRDEDGFRTKEYWLGRLGECIRPHRATRTCLSVAAIWEEDLKPSGRVEVDAERMAG